MIEPTIDYSKLTNAETLVIQSIAAGTYFIKEELVGVIDGVNFTFTSTYAPNPVILAELWWNGQKLRYNTDYTILGLNWSVLIDGITPIDAGYLASSYINSPI